MIKGPSVLECDTVEILISFSTKLMSLLFLGDKILNLVKIVIILGLHLQKLVLSEILRVAVFEIE